MEETVRNNRAVVTASQSTLPSLSSRANDYDDLIPVSRSEFAAEVSPLLSLVAPSGMAGDERTAWLTAAYRALAGIPVGLLQRGVAAAMLTADHPSKIVVEINREIRETWDNRKRNQPITKPQTPSEPAESRIAPPVEEIPMDELRAMPKYMHSMGLTAGWITQAQLDMLAAELAGGEEQG